MVHDSAFARFHSFLAIALAAVAAGIPAQAAEDSNATELDEIVVTATLRSAPIIDVPASVTVLPRQTLEDAGRANFEDVLGLIPNLNWAGDTSLPRYFQLRGIGELEQYQGAPNPSVGFLIDDIDFSGLGTAGTLYDIDQIDVLRGPQPTRYGANALAGLIYMKSAEPTNAPYARVDLEGGDYGVNSEGAVVSGPVDSLDSAFRIAAQRYYSNGYYHNLYLNRDDTNRQDEYTFRAKWTFTPSEPLRIELTAMQVDIDNGYDAYAIDNSRNTESDQPGVDVPALDGRRPARSLPGERCRRFHRHRHLCQVGHPVQLRRRLGQSRTVGARRRRGSVLRGAGSIPLDQDARAQTRHRVE